MSQVETAVQAAMPANTEELRTFIAGTMNEILAIPGNTNIQAEQLLGHLLGLVQKERASNERAAMRPVVVSTYYRGSARATIGLDEATGTFLVSFDEEIKDSEGKVVFEPFELNGVQMQRPTWKAMELPEGAREMLAKTVLSQPVQPGQIFYVTTAQGVEAHMEAMTDVFQKQDALRDQLDNASPEELLQSEEARTVAKAAQ